MTGTPACDNMAPVQRTRPYANDFGPFDGRIWLNTAHQGPLPRIASEAAMVALEEKTRPHLLRDESFFAVPKRLRAALGKLIGVHPDDIILANSTTYGLDLLANAIPWQSGDEVLLVDGDFPADVFPWLLLGTKGVSVRFIKPQEMWLKPQDVAQAISSRTRLLCATWVNSFNGFAIDMAAIGRVCRDNNVIFVLNASQALGARVLDLRNEPVDAITCCGYKWLCGPYATGFCWLSSTLRESLIPLHAYWLAMQAGKPLNQMRDYSLRGDLGARTWDVFCPANFLNFVPWTAAVEYLLQAGPERVAAYDQALVTQLLATLHEDHFELVSPRTEPHRSTLIVLRPRRHQDVEAWQRRLLQSGLDVAVREGNLRISPHLHNTSEDIAKLSEALSMN